MSLKKEINILLASLFVGTILFATIFYLLVGHITEVNVRKQLSHTQKLSTYPSNCSDIVMMGVADSEMAHLAEGYCINVSEPTVNLCYQNNVHGRWRNFRGDMVFLLNYSEEKSNTLIIRTYDMYAMESRYPIHNGVSVSLNRIDWALMGEFWNEGTNSWKTYRFNVGKPDIEGVDQIYVRINNTRNPDTPEHPAGTRMAYIALCQ